jgi:hypothetical protein
MTGVRQFSSFEELPKETRELFEKAGEDCFFSSLPWFRVFVDHALDAGDLVKIYSTPQLAESEGSMRAALATVHRVRSSAFFRPRKLSSLSNYYSSLFGPVGSETHGGEAARSLAKAIAEDSPPWDEVELKPLDVNSVAFGALKVGLQSAGFVVQTYFCFGNWYLDVNGRSYAQYLEDLPSVLRNTIVRKKKKLEKSNRAKIAIVTGGEDLQAAIEAYEKVYSASWKQPEPYPNFVPELIRACAAMGTLRLGVLHVDGKPAAAQFWIVQNGVALIYKLAYDEAYTDLSVGSILTATLMQHALDVDRVREVDYLTGDDSYKKDWMSGRRERWGILAMNPHTVRGAAAIVRHVGGRTVKRAIKSLNKNLFKPADSLQKA